MKGNRIFIVLALVVISLVAIFLFARNKNEKDFYQLVGVFPNSAELTSGQEINCLGQKIGSIKETKLKIQRRQVTIIMLIKNSIKIPVGSVLEVNVNSLLGSKSLAIIPPANPDRDVFCQPGDTLQGQAPITLTEIQNKLGSLIDTATSKIHQLNISNLNQTINTVQHTAGQISLAIDNLKPRLDSTVSNANQLIKTYRQTGEKIETTMAAIDSLAQKGSKSIDSLPTLIQKGDSAVHAIDIFFKGLNRFFGFHD